MKRHLSTRLIVGLLVVLGPAGLVTACGGSDDASDATSATAAPAAEGADDGATVPTDAGADTTDEVSEISLPEEAIEDCTGLSDETKAALLDAADDENFAGLQTAINLVRDEVPDDLKDDVDVLSEAYGKLAALVEANGGDTEKALADPELQAQFEALASDEVTAASDALDAYFAEVCPELSEGS